MTVTSVTSRILAVPHPRPVGEQATLYHLVVEVATDEGVSGIGPAFTWQSGQTRTVAAMVGALAPQVVGRDPFDTVGCWQRMWDAARFVGHKGVAIFALSAIDTALWDLKARALGLPLARLLGSARRTVPCYASGRLSLALSRDELVDEARRILDQGFTAMKMNVGLPSLAEDLRRVEAVRGAIGDGVRLMADANQRWTRLQALEAGRALEPYGLAWLEEPVAADDVEGLALVAQALATPVATGEQEYTKLGFRRLAEAGAADVLMPDLQRSGGVTEWLKIAAIAEAWQMPISSHVFVEPHVHLMASIPNGLILEHMPRWDDLLVEPIRVEAGHAHVPALPGLGVEFKPEVWERYRVG